VNYTDAAGQGFNDPTYGASRKSAFSYALNIWSNYLQASYAGETVRVDASFTSLGGTATSATLGSAGSQYIWGLGSPTSEYGDALANHKSGYDVNDTYVGPNTAEIRARFNSDVDNSTVLGNTNFYYGTNGQPGGNIDFVSVVLHEFGHGLNFFDTVNSSTGGYEYGAPGIYDRFLWDSATGRRFDNAAETDAQRKAAITSGNLLWDGAYGVAANGGVRPKIYAPNPYESGSSVSHLDETTYPNDLMSPMYSGVDHAPSATDLGMLRDMGWTLVPEPGIIGVAVTAGLFTLTRRTRKSA
jgi:hypothetical protein